MQPRNTKRAPFLWTGLSLTVLLSGLLVPNTIVPAEAGRLSGSLSVEAAGSSDGRITGLTAPPVEPSAQQPAKQEPPSTASAALTSLPTITPTTPAPTTASTPAGIDTADPNAGLYAQLMTLLITKALMEQRPPPPSLPSPEDSSYYTHLMSLLITHDVLAADAIFDLVFPETSGLAAAVAQGNTADRSSRAGTGNAETPEGSWLAGAGLGEGRRLSQPVAAGHRAGAGRRLQQGQNQALPIFGDLDSMDARNELTRKESRRRFNNFGLTRGVSATTVKSQSGYGAFGSINAKLRQNLKDFANYNGY